MSSSLLWQRRAALTITKRSIAGSSSVGKRFENMRVTFTGEKNAEGNVNTMTAVLYNPNQDTVTLAQEKERYVLLDIAYGPDKMATLFEGDIISAQFDPTGPDTKLTIKIGDGRVPKNLKMSKSWAPKVDFGAIAQDIANEIKRLGGVIVGEIASVFGSDDAKAKAKQIAERGYSVQGVGFDKLTEIANARGLEASIQDNELVVLPPNGYTGEAIVAKKETGLIGVPQTLCDEKTGKDYLEFKMLITTTRLRPHRLVKLESRERTANVVIRSVKFDGDTRGNNWYATVTGVAI